MSIRNWIKIVEAGFDNHNSAEKRGGETAFMKHQKKPAILNKDGKADPVDAEEEIPKQKKINKKK
jgi:hypothetical protein